MTHLLTTYTSRYVISKGEPHCDVTTHLPINQRGGGSVQAHGDVCVSAASTFDGTPCILCMPHPPIVENPDGNSLPCSDLYIPSALRRLHPTSSSLPISCSARPRTPRSQTLSRCRLATVRLGKGSFAAAQGRGQGKGTSFSGASLWQWACADTVHMPIRAA
ncbi:ADP-ribosylation factor-like protein 4A [Platysternon megacephalum]|uniref:ADP-ribosylation factor-like protein 4A n=1 Tax=Platysternon megacephalum TaxID=55544 RepID=A0A4D9EQ08_9SAUR|nr:ADP-ribosylation factor-like protein 4A [Platysternon megacephalum]